MSKSIITAARLRELLHYEPTTGFFTWRIASPRRSAGSRAGSKNARGYIYITVDGWAYPAHRLAWLYVHDVWPTEKIDHKFGIKDDNRISELRDVTQQENCMNRQGAQVNSSTGVRGVSPWRGRFRAFISVNKKQICLGSFATIEEAAEAIRDSKAHEKDFLAQVQCTGT